VLTFRIRRRILAVGLALAAATGAFTATPAFAAAPRQRVDLQVLVLTNGSTGVDTIVAQLDREGVPYTIIDLTAGGRPAITAATLADTIGGVRRAKYQGVVVPNETSVSGAEATALADFEREFGVRQITAYTGATAAVGLTIAWSGVLDGANLTVTNEATAAGFGYLNGSVGIDDRDPAVDESYGYLGTAAPGATFTPLVTATAPGGGPTGSLLGVYAHDGRQELVVTLAMNRFQTHAMVLGHGLVQWLTKGVHLGHWRNWFSVHVDDIFLSDDRWDTGANCTVGDNCNPTRDPSLTPYNTPIRMQPADVTKLLAWQQQQGIKLDMTFNGEGSVEAGASDPLSASLLANRSQLRWLNHTYSHAFLGCVQDFTVSPWRCATDASGNTTWVSQAVITSQINDNVNWARGKGITLDPTEVVTGEHSGLRSLPQMSTDNPNLAPALAATGVRVIASDASRESVSRPIGPAVTEKRWPMNIYYNVGTAAEEVDEYNWIYTSRANGGSGICADNPTTSTCITPLSSATGFTNYIVPIETRIAYDHLVSTDPAPHYAHQSNLTEDRVLYPVLDSVLARYHATYTAATPVVNPRMADIALQHKRQGAWLAAAQAHTVEAYTLDGRVTVVNHGAATLDVPITVPTGTKTVTLSLLGIELLGGNYGEAYGAEQSAWKPIAHNGQQLLRLPS
jgi:hypothetical protein